MLRFILLLLLLLSQVIFGQQKTEEEQVKTAINNFFEGFHMQDSLLIKQMVKAPIMQTIVTKDGAPIIRTEKFSDFLRAIVSIPPNKKFREELLDYTIQIDGDMAHAWTPYKFWLNDELSHCGANSFQLVKDRDEWKIIYIIDTRRREGCE